MPGLVRNVRRSTVADTDRQGFRTRGRSLSSDATPVASGPRLEATGAIGGLARFVAEARLGDWPDEVRSKAKACLLYGLAVGAAGARTRLPRGVARMLDRTETQPASR